MIAPRGGTLIHRALTGLQRQNTLDEVAGLTKIQLSDWSYSDLELIGTGAFSPLTGFMSQKDYDSVLDTLHLITGEIWSIPITLPVDQKTAQSLKPRGQSCLWYHR